MSKISDMYEQIKLQQYTLIKTKLQEAVMARKEKRELSREEKEDYTFTDDEATILIKMLEEQGFIEGKDFINFFQSDYDSPDYSVFVVKIDSDYIVLSTDSWGGEDIPIITNIESIREMIDRFKDVELEEDMLKIVSLTDIDLEQIQIGSSSRENEDSVETAKNKAIDARENLVRAKLRETINDMMVGKEQSSNNGLNRDNEIYVLLDMLKKAGFEEGKDFSFEEEPFEYNDTVPELHIRVGNDILHFSGMNSATDIIPMQELEEDVKENPEYYDARLLRLKPIKLEKLGLSIDSIQKLSKAKTTNDIRQQFEESLLRDDIVEYYLSKTPEELEAELGTEVARMVGFEQKNMHHCYDLWGHTLHTVEAVDTTGLTEGQAKKLKVAAFFHDIGKPDVTGFNPKTEQQTFYNHAVHSVDIAKPILESLGYSESEINQIGFFIGHHDDFINYKPSLDPKQKGHAFFREINPSTVSEIVTQNKYDFDKLGFESYLPTHTESEETNKKNNAINNENKLKIRYICSTLNNNGVEPVFKDFRGNPINISVDMEDVQSKIFSGEYDAQYIPSLEDYQLLLELCKADARAQSEEVKDKSGNIVDSRKRKLETMEKIEQVIPEAYKNVEDRDKFLASILKSATKRVQTMEQAKKAKELEHEYDKQLPQNQQSLDDN